MIGTNDLNDNIDIANAPTRLGKLIDEIITDAPAALVVVSQHHADREQRTSQTCRPTTPRYQGS